MECLLPQNRSFLLWNLYSAKGLQLVVIACDLGIFVLRLYIIALLTQFIKPQNLPYDFTMGISTWLTVSFSVLASFCFALLRMGVEVAVRKKIISRIQRDAQSNVLSPKVEDITILVSRDLRLLLEFASQALFPFYAAVAIAIILVYLVAAQGATNAALFISVGLFIPLSMLIARKSMVLAKEIYYFSKVRIEKTAAFLQFRAYYINWGLLSDVLRPIREVKQSEIRARNLDSWWRSLDLYSIAFGRGVPILCILLAGILLGHEHNTSILEIWLVLPCIALAMEAGRYSSDFVQAKQAYKHLRGLLQPLDTTKSAITLDGSWDIWSGTIADNNFASLESDFTIYSKLRLDSELGIQSLAQLNVRYLERGGENLSHGQKIRMLVVRALQLAILEQKALHISLPLDGLDPDACVRLQALLSQYTAKLTITISQANQKILESQAKLNRNGQFTISQEVRARQLDAAPSFNHTPVLKGKSLTQYLPIMILVFLLPAVLLNAYPLVLEAAFAPKTKIILLLALMAGGISIASYFGYLVEKAIRANALRKLINLLSFADHSDAVDMQQRASKDFTLALEPIACYMHDIAWYAALLSVALISVGAVFGWPGVAISLAVSILFTIHYRICAPWLLRARQAMIKAINDTLDHLYNLAAIGDSLTPNLNLKRIQFIGKGLHSYQTGHLRHYLARAIASQVVVLLMGCTIAAVCYMAQNYNEHAALELVLNALLTVEAIVVLFFQATLGLYAQYISWKRLSSYPAGGDDTAPPISVVDGRIEIAAFSHSSLSSEYARQTLPLAKVVSLIGPSGAGKTNYLKALAGFTPVNTRTGKVLYFAEQAQAILQSATPNQTLETFILDKVKSKCRSLIILDESLSILELEDAKAFIGVLEQKLESEAVTIIIVDHRFVLGNAFTVPLINKSGN